ncbi:MAG: hypothetical protein ACRDQZ_09175 [Mycobacteriales bacterium]
MNERPIIMQPESVKAILEGRKTQTRRVIKPQPPSEAKSCGVLRAPGTKYHGHWWWLDAISFDDATPLDGEFRCPYGMWGDRLWVREAWLPVVDGADHGTPGWLEWTPDPERPVPDDGYNEPEAILYKATDDHHPPRWRNAMFMPRWASRITLELVDVRVERVQEINNDDAKAEGVVPDCRGDHLTHEVACHIETYEDLWDSINEKRGFGWQKNPWVWVLEFERKENAHVD